MQAWIRMSRSPFVLRSWPRPSMSGRCVFSRRRKPLLLGMGAYRACLGLPVFAGRPLKRGNVNFGSLALFRVNVFDETAGGANKRAPWIGRYSPLWKTWWSRCRAAIRRRHCDGHAKARGPWPARSWSAGMPPASAWSGRCFIVSAIAFRPTARRRRATSTPTVSERRKITFTPYRFACGRMV